MSVRIPYTPRSNHTHECLAEKAVEPASPRNGVVQSRDMAEISMSLRQISDILDSSATPHCTTEAGADGGDLWVDEEYLYMDLAYSVSDELMMDVCVHEGRAFIRVSKTCLRRPFFEMSA
jgi:hypothetical protein